MTRTFRTRDKVLALALTAYLGFGVACIFGDESNNNNGTTNNGGGSGGVTEFNGNVDSDEAWSGTVNVNSNVLIRDGGNLTIAAGTVINMCVDCTFDIGWNSNAATIKIDGTAEKPVTFRGDSDDKGFWKFFSVGKNTTSNSYIKHVIIKNAGQKDASALKLEGSIVLDNVEVVGSAGDGVSAFDFGDGSKELKVSEVDGYPVRLTSDVAVNNYPAQSSRDLVKGGKGYIALDFRDIDDNITIRNLSLPYFISDDLLIRGDNITAEVDKGVQFDVNVDKSIDIAWNSNVAGIKFNGTQEEPIVFQGVTDDVGVWDGLYFGDKILSTSVISHLVVRNAGSKEGAVNFKAAVKVDHLTIEKSKTYGLVVDEEGLGDDSTMITVKDGEGIPVRIHSTSLHTLPTDGTFAQGNSATDYIDVYGGNVFSVGTISKSDVPYQINDKVLIRDAGSWTIEPGVTMNFGPGTYIEVGWNGNEATFIAKGTAAEPIIFGSVDPSKGYWKGIYVNKNATSNTVLDYVEFSYGGEDDAANLTLDRPVPVTNSSFSNSNGYGIHVDYNASDAQDPSIDYEASNTFSGNDKGDILDNRVP